MSFAGQRRAQLITLPAMKETPSSTRLLDWIKKNPILRGACVGLTVLVLIRSKAFALKGADVGGEYFYNWGRSWVMQSINTRWRTYKNQFNGANLDKALVIADFQIQLFEQLRQSLRVDDEELRIFVEGQIKTIEQNIPTVPFNAATPQWRAYYRTLMSLGLDYAGPNVFDWAGF